MNTHEVTMKATRKLMIGLVLSAVAAFPAGYGQQKAVETPSWAPVNVFEMKAVPDGNFLVNLQVAGEECRLNFKVKENQAKCVRSSVLRFQGLEGKFQLIGNGVFLVSFANREHRATQFWLFRPEGTAVVKEVPDRGEVQTAVPVQDDTLAPPKRDQ